jgi:hypothetical protein
VCECVSVCGGEREREGSGVWRRGGIGGGGECVFKCVCVRFCVSATCMCLCLCVHFFAHPL